MFTRVKPKQKALDAISSARVTKSFRLRPGSFCLYTSETVKNEDWLGEVVAPSLSQTLPPGIGRACAACGLNPPQPPTEAPVWQRVPSGHRSKPPTPSSSTLGTRTRTCRPSSGPFPLVTVCPTPDLQGPKVDSAPSPDPKHPFSAKLDTGLWGTVTKEETIVAPRRGSLTLRVITGE